MYKLFRHYVILVGITFLGITGCSGFISYDAHTAPEDSLFLIEFDYPADWNWQINAKGHIIASDPYGYGDFGIFVTEKNTLYEITTDMNQSMQARFLFGADRNAYITFEPVEIDGYSAKRITLTVPANLGHGYEKPWIQETYYLLIGNQLYDISLNIDQDQRHGAFGRGFDHVIKTIRVIAPQPAP
jgi:hypothetical protein